MSLTAILLILCSAVTHVGWNLIGKKESPTAAFFLFANIAGTVLLTPVLFQTGEWLYFLSGKIWLLLIITSFFQAAYYTALASAYRHGDLSLAYPLARTFPVILVGLISTRLSHASSLSNLSMLGMVLIVFGALMLPMKHFKDFATGNYLNLMTLFALFAAFGTTGYSLVDDYALKNLSQNSVISESGYLLSVFYLWIVGVLSSLFMWVGTILRPVERANLKNIFRSKLPMILGGGFAMYISYALVLASMAFVTNVSYVVAFRQISVPLGALAGIFILKESMTIPRLSGVVVMFFGLILVGVY